MTSILSCGTFFGALLAGDIADFIGRRPTIIAGCGLFSIGCILEIASTNQEVLFVLGRLVAGGGVGFISAVILLYLSEISPRKVRGAIVSGYQFCITLGILLATCVVYSTQDRNDTGSYRIPIGVQFLWALILGVGLFLLRMCPYVSHAKPHSAPANPSQPSLHDIMSKEATYNGQRGTLPRSVASLSIRSISRTNWPRSSRTMSTRHKRFLTRATSGPGLRASRAPSGKATVTYVGLC